MSTTGRLAVLFATVQGLVFVRETWGQDAAAQALEALTEGWAAWLHPTDTLVRTDATRFAVICPDTHDPEVVMGLADSLRAVGAGLLVRGRPIALTVSLSVVFTAHQPAVLTSGGGG